MVFSGERDLGMGCWLFSVNQLGLSEEHEEVSEKSKNLLEFSFSDGFIGAFG